jgi:transcriptional regulator of arginine metabolism
VAERTDTQARLQALRKLLVKEDASTQDELRDELEKLDYEVNQSTISRDLRKLGAIKMIDTSGRTVYRIADEMARVAPPSGLGTLITNIEHNGFMIVVHTSPGSASLVARQIDQLRSSSAVLGTIAGDDTVFICPRNPKETAALVKRIERLLSGLEN